jgi:phenylacetate-CoA ligase
MDKAVLREVAREVQERGPDAPTRLQRTGGTTSSPDEFLESRSAWAFEKAFFSRWYRQHGFVFGDRMVTVTGTFGGRAVAYNPIANELNIYVREFSDAVGDDLVSRIVTFNPRMIRGYPSLMYLLASHVMKRGTPVFLPRLVAVFLGSEQVLPWQADTIERAFRVPVTSHYGQGERVALIQRCLKGPLMHVAELYSYVEFLREDGLPASEDGDLAMVVGSSFANMVTPLIRYKMDDWVVVAGGDTCPDCRRNVRSVRSIEGRSGDFIVTPSGRRWSPTVLEFAVRHARHIRDMRIVQRDLTSVEVLVVPAAEYVADDGQSFVRELESRVGEATMSFKLVETSNISRPRSQKQRFVVSMVASADSNRKAEALGGDSG